MAPRPRLRLSSQANFLGVDRNGALSLDPEVQFRNAFERVAAVLAAAGLSFADVVEMTTYHVGLQHHLTTFMKVKDAYVHAPYPGGPPLV